MDLLITFLIVALVLVFLVWLALRQQTRGLHRMHRSWLHQARAAHTELHREAAWRRMK